MDKSSITQGILQRRLEKLEAQNKEKLQKLPKTLTHFGFDATDALREASQTSTSDQDLRDTLASNIKKDKTATNLGRLTDVFGKDIIGGMKKGGVFHQDLRIEPEKGGKYEGMKITVSKVSGSLGDAKKTPEPSSPRPGNLGVRGYHRAHTSPFQLTGEDGETAGTVWAPEFANLTIDKSMEQYALWHANNGKNVWQVRLDTHDRSTVAVVRSRTKGDDESNYAVMAVQYRRKFD